MSIDFSAQRLSYEKDALIEAQVPKTPYPLISAWVQAAVNEQIGEAYAFSLATCGTDGMPSVRTLLMRKIHVLEDDGVGCVFYSNYDSDKGQDLLENPYAEALFFWPSLERQLRIRGRVVRLNEIHSATYFNSRPKDSQLAAWVSEPQSGKVSGRDVMQARFDALKAAYADKEVPKPDFWGGYELIASRIEFWQGRANRMHDRIVYVRDNNQWQRFRLLP